MENDLNTPEGIEGDDALSYDEAEAIGSFFTSDDEPAQEATENSIDGIEEATAEDDAESQDDETDVLDDEDQEGEQEEGDEENAGNPVEASQEALVTMPDGTKTTVHELIRGNLREADYTQKNQQRVELEREAQTALQSAMQEREMMAAMLTQMMPQEPDISMTDPNSPTFDPAGYTHQKALYDQHIGKMRALHENHIAAQQQFNQQQEQISAQNLAKEMEAARAAIPELSDPQKRAELQANLASFVSDYQVKAEELDLIVDHRHLRILKDAMDNKRELDRLRSKGANARNRQGKVPPVIKPKSRRAKSGNRGVQDRIDKALKAGRPETVSDIIGQLITGN